MLKSIVYKTNTGHTFEYAKMLSEKLEIPYYSIKEAKTKLNKNDEIIYLGWVCAGKISGLGKVKNRYNIKYYGAVGAYPLNNEYIEGLKKANNIVKPLFYLRGGIDYTKLKGIKKKIVQMVGKVLEKEDRQNRELIEIFKNGANFVSEKNIEQMLKSIKEDE